MCHLIGNYFGNNILSIACKDWGKRRKLKVSIVVVGRGFETNIYRIQVFLRHLPCAFTHSRFLSLQYKFARNFDRFF